MNCPFGNVWTKTKILTDALALEKRLRELLELHHLCDPHEQVYLELLEAISGEDKHFVEASGVLRTLPCTVRYELHNRLNVVIIGAQLLMRQVLLARPVSEIGNTGHRLAVHVSRAIETLGSFRIRLDQCRTDDTVADH
jgi:hypothetical protein